MQTKPSSDSIQSKRHVPNTPPKHPALGALRLELQRLYPGRGRPKAETIHAARCARLNRGRGLEERRVGMIAAMVVGRVNAYEPEELSRLEKVLAGAESRGLDCPPAAPPMDRATARRVQVARDAAAKGSRRARVVDGEETLA